MEAKEIVNIGLEHIHPHPDNPRKDLGDLTELAESIKKNGILQNLTVIPKEGEPGEYIAIIGHRRSAAAKLAGVTEAPCRIVEGMTHKEQVSTMLEENMQRGDLTIWEQAQGFQMMLDLGDTAEQIADKTGFSKTTIRHRLNIAKLDQKELKKKTDEHGAFQLSLKDLYELEKIEDIKIRDRVLKEAHDSRDLVWRAKQAVIEETRQKNLKAFISLFEKAGIKPASKKAEEERWSEKWEVLKEWQLDKPAPEALGKLKGDNLQYVTYWGNTVAVIKPAKKKEKKLSEYEIQQIEIKNAKKEIRQKAKAMFDKADIFIKEVIAGKIQPVKEDVELYKELLCALAAGNVEFWESDIVKLYCGKDMYEAQKNESEYQEFLKWKENLSPLHRVIAQMSGIRKYDLYRYNAEWDENNARRIKAVFSFLAKYGFSVSEEEEKLLDGTHELYVKNK
ncbi:MAG: ParB/RepB/Spo0J family partition protein [Lachnospira sp.]